MPPSPLAKSRKRLSHGASEREEMDSHFENIWSFYLSSYFNSFEWRYGSCLFFYSVFFKEDDPYSMRIQLLEGSISWIDHLRWIGSVSRFWVFVVRGIVRRRWISIPGVGHWHARHFEASRQWVCKGERSVDDKYLPRTDSPFGKAQNNSR